MQPIVPEFLRRTVLALSRRPLDRMETNALAGLCHDLALVAARNRISAASLQVRFPFESHSDIAYDCVADLFRQDENGLLLQFKAFFDAIDVDGCSDEDLLIHLRRLVFSRVNHGIYRILQEADPELGRIIRNIKLAVQGLPALAPVERFGETCLAPVTGETLEHLPSLSTEELVQVMGGLTPPPAHIPGFLAGLALHLRRQETRSRTVPIVRLALAVRMLYGTTRTRSDNGTIEDRWTVGDVERVVCEVLTTLRRRVHARYVGRQKLGAEQLEIYLQVVHDHLCDRFAGDGRPERSLFERLRHHQPELDRAGYVDGHRTRLEYLLKLATKDAERMLRDAAG